MKAAGCEFIRSEKMSGTKRAGRAELATLLQFLRQSSKSMLALANLRRVCEEHLSDHYTIEVVDLLRDPSRAAGDQIIAVPTLVRQPPGQRGRIIGNLGDTEKVLAGLGVRSRAVQA